MIFDLSDKAAAPKKEYDVVVVGAGAVGLTMAVNLARGGMTVALLEAGPMLPIQESQALFEAASASGRPLPGLHLGRFRALGGTTNFWGGQLVPFDDHIFLDRPWACAGKWPIRRTDLDAYYKSTLELLGMSHALEDGDVWRQLNVPPPKATREITPFFTRWTPTTNFAHLFRADLVEEDRLHVYVNAPVKAMISIDGETITGVEVASNTHGPMSIKSAKFVLANGTVEIVRLLKLPLADGQSTAWGENAWLGVGFMDHIDCHAGQVEPLDKRRFSEVFDNAFVNGVKYSPKLRLSGEAQQRGSLLDISAHFIHRSSFGENIANLKIFLKGIARGRINRTAFGNPLKTISALRFAVPMVLRYLRYRRMYNVSDGGIVLRLTSEQSPYRSSTITLRSDCDPFGVPNVDVNWQFRDSDIETLASFAEQLSAYLREEGLAEVTLDQRLLNRDPAFMDNIDDANHHMGGVRMAENAAEGVVDRNLKVFGTRNLYVAGAAVYPSTGFANPTFTAIALGQRLADHLSAGKG